ncbi:hypothetical protein GCM10022402_28970 [Salinactinospora qingdaonensis]|uniref:Secreted protein n=1 Tax=Salinactinospora qingdaonensis TaxID=702744 RepID=A0ABP7FUM9_9ACTN
MAVEVSSVVALAPVAAAEAEEAEEAAPVVAVVAGAVASNHHLLPVRSRRGAVGRPRIGTTYALPPAVSTAGGRTAPFQVERHAFTLDWMSSLTSCWTTGRLRGAPVR